MEIKDRILELRKSTGMNRKEFCEYFGIPYRTVTEWERGTRRMPDYVLRMIIYQINMERLNRQYIENSGEDANEE
ncbi:MAG: helix-turn-helix domain-containing protein [Acetivibrio sp.]